MATIVISDEKYQHLKQRAELINSSPEAVIDELLDGFLASMMLKSDPTNEMIDPNSPSIHTLGDLLKYGYGFWADRDDIEDAGLYATQLRQEAWQRNW
jgi:hypothetical protein